VRRRYARGGVPIDRPVAVLYRVIDALVDSFFPLLAGFDDRIDRVEEEIFHSPSDACLQEVCAMKRFLVTLRKVITPQRDLFSGLPANMTVPGP
jgi:magnesium transporter